MSVVFIFLYNTNTRTTMLTTQQIIIVFIGAVLIYVLYFRKTETFTTNQKLSIQTSDNKFATICADRHLCLTSDKASEKLFSVLKFADDLIALENEGYYITSCFGESCDTDVHITVSTFNPYAPNCKLKIIPDGSYNLVQFYDGQYMSVNNENHIVRTTDKSKAIKVAFV